MTFVDGGDLVSLGWQMLKISPEPEPPRIPAHLPEGVERALRAAEKNFPDPDLAETAAGAYGRALELATKEKAPEFKGNLAGRISHLASTGKITSDLAEWANHIRLVRNDALHGYEPVSKDELVAVRGLTEMLLTYLYSLPGMLADLRAKGPKET